MVKGWVKGGFVVLKNKKNEPVSEFVFELGMLKYYILSAKK